MTTLLDPPVAPDTATHGFEPGEAAVETDGGEAPGAPPSARQGMARATHLRLLLLIWLGAFVAGMAFVAYGFGPFFQQRDQRTLMRTYRAAVANSANEATGLGGVTTATKAPVPGSPVGILEVGAIRLQQVVIEGTTASDTRKGPGHVPGTAGLGQPGNSVVVGRRSAFGRPFSGVNGLKPRDEVVVTTTQGQSVYAVTSATKVSLHGGAIDSVYGPSKDDRLTLVTSGSALPWNNSTAEVVVAKLKGTPFAPTPQGGRLDSQIGTKGDQGAAASVILAFLVYGIVMGASVLLYRRLQPRTAYLLTIAPILALTIIAAETLSRVFPAWS